MHSSSLLASGRLYVSALALLAIQGAQAQVAPAPVADAPAPIELSPFTVSADSDDGWVATSSLAGSRLNTSLRDTGAAINVLTSEFLMDIGANDMSEAIGYSVNMHETLTREGGTNDNFAMEFFDGGRINVRGIPATATRNYFRWRLQSDNYNADRIEENRGPNSILFGIGSAGGVVNTLTKQANTSRDIRKASVQVAAYDSYRATVDVNQRALDGRMAVRFNAVYSDYGSFRHHLYNKTHRFHLASSYRLRDTTRFRIDAEAGKIRQVTGRGTPALDSVTSWLNAGSPLIPGNQAANTQLGINRLATNQIRVTYVHNSGEVFNFQGHNRTSGAGVSILDQNLADFSVNPAGPGNFREGDVRSVSVFWEEKLGDNTFFEFSHNLQKLDSDAWLAGQGTQANAMLLGDPNLLLPNGATNPYAGEMMFEGERLSSILNNDTANTSRVMVSHELALGKWGKYRFAAMGEYEKRNASRSVRVEAWEGRPFNNSPENAANQVYRRHYVTQGDWKTYYAAGPGATGLLRDIPDPTTPGRLLNSTWVAFNQGGQTNPIEQQRTAMLGLQARYWDNRIVFGGGLRRDRLDIRSVQALRDPVTNQWTLKHPDIVPLNQRFYGTTRTLGLVGHATRNISLYYNYSNSLDLPNSQHRILPDGRPPPAPDAQGQDIGLGLSFFDGRLSARLNAFEVELLNATGAGFGGSFSNPQVFNRRVLTGLLNAGLITQQIYDERDFDSNTAIRNRKLEGYELSLNGQITRNWNVSLNYSYTDGYDSEIAPEIKEWAAAAVPWMMQWPNALVNLDGTQVPVSVEVQRWQNNAAQEWLREGDLILGNRKHKGNVFTRYNFRSGRLNGLFVGGGYRYHGKAPVNFIANEVLAFNHSRAEADLLAGYTFRNVPFLPRGLRLQLNVQNVLDNDDPRITHFSSNGSISRVNVEPGRSWRLTANFDF